MAGGGDREVGSGKNGICRWCICLVSITSIRNIVYYLVCGMVSRDRPASLVLVLLSVFFLPVLVLPMMVLFIYRGKL